MFKKPVLIFLVLILGSAIPAAQAATRTDTVMDMVTEQNPVAEKACLEAFVNSRFSHAFNLCLPLAQNGMRDAQLVTGLMYAFGSGTGKNPEMAALWLKEAVRNGSAEAKEVLMEFNLLD